MISRDQYERLLDPRDDLRFYIQMPDGQVLRDVLVSNNAINIYPGSFNPLHRSHKSIYYYAKYVLNYNNSYFELSLKNRDKPDVAYDDLIKRLDNFAWYAPVLISKSPLFLDKIKMIRSINPKLEIGFSMGFDTASRLCSDHNPKDLDIDNVIYWVYPRIIDGKIQSLNDISNGKIPPNMLEIKGKFGGSGESSSKIRSMR